MAAAFDAGSIFVNLRTRTKKWREGFRQAGGAARRFGNTMRAVGTRLRSVGRAMRGFGKTLTTRVTLPIMGAFGSMAKAMDRQAQAEAQLDAAIRSTGGVANVTAEHVKGLASSIQKVTTFGDEAIIEMASLGLTFTNVRNQGKGLNAIFDRTVQLATDVAAANRMELAPAMRLVGQAVDDPIQGLTTLTGLGVTFTQEQKKQITELVKSGKLLEAQGVVMDVLNSKFSGSAKALAEVGLGPLKQGFNALTGSLEKFGEAMQPAIDAIGQALKDFSAWLDNLSSGEKKILLVIVGIVAGLGPLLIIIGELSIAIGVAVPALWSFGAAMTAALGPIGLVAVAIGGITLVITNMIGKTIAGTKEMKLYVAEAQRLSKTVTGQTAVVDEDATRAVIKFGDAMRELRKFGPDMERAGEFGSEAYFKVGEAAEEAASQIGDSSKLSLGILRAAGVDVEDIERFQEAYNRALEEIREAAEKANPVVLATVELTPEAAERMRLLVRNFGEDVEGKLDELVDQGGLAMGRTKAAIQKFGDRGREDLKKVVEESQRLDTELRKVFEALKTAGPESYDVLIQAAERMIRKSDELREMIVLPTPESLPEPIEPPGQDLGEDLLTVMERATLAIQTTDAVFKEFGESGTDAFKQPREAADGLLAELSRMMELMATAPPPKVLALMEGITEGILQDLRAVSQEVLNPPKPKKDPEKDVPTIMEKATLAIETSKKAFEHFGDESSEAFAKAKSSADVLVTEITKITEKMDVNGTPPELLVLMEERAKELLQDLKAVNQELLRPPKEDKKTEGLSAEQQGLADSVAQAGQAIGQGLLQGLEQGKKGVELLADVGKQLFVQAGNKAIEQLTKQAGVAIAKIAGTSSEIAQGVMNTLIAAVGLILSQLDKASESVETFANLAPEVESSQLVRGIVAGPQNVAIAEVGENIATAFLPTNERLEAIIGLIQEGLLVLGAGGGGGDEVPSAGRTQTP